MADDQKKGSTQPTAVAPSPSSPGQPPSKTPVMSKTSPISRRAFLIGALGASTLLTAAAFAQSALPPDFGILGPLIPTPEPPIVVGSAIDLETRYQAAVNANTLTTAFNSAGTNFSAFCAWPYPLSISPYYKNIIIRLPDDKYLANQSASDQWLGQTFNSSIVTAPTGGRFVGFNTTCVHLRCLVNPGYADGQFRLQCPCHGSQYNMTDGVPVAGPAFDLGLNPLPKLELSIDSSGKITATNLIGQPGVGRTTQ